ncbi:hypothetical protein, partial [Yersinia aldovae]|uniref:hypothetical protein n=1 Tax=Yersinia aldovae TaxID=29483 RepID=UPI001C9535CB
FIRRFNLACFLYLAVKPLFTNNAFYFFNNKYLPNIEMLHGRIYVTYQCGYSVNKACRRVSKNDTGL